MFEGRKTLPDVQHPIEGPEGHRATMSCCSRLFAVFLKEHSATSERWKVPPETPRNTPEGHHVKHSNIVWTHINDVFVNSEWEFRILTWSYCTIYPPVIKHGNWKSTISGAFNEPMIYTWEFPMPCLIPGGSWESATEVMLPWGLGKWRRS